MIRFEDSQIMALSDLAGTIGPGEILEMTIVLRRKMVYQRKCPRCGHKNLNATTSGWIEWQVAFKFLLGLKINAKIAVEIVLDNSK
jgi:hypothetical protein